MNFSPQDNGDHLETASLYALQVLSPQEGSAFEVHLSTCAECRRHVGTLRPIIATFASWPTDMLRPSASLWDRLSQRISASPEGMPNLPPAELPVSEWEEVAAGISCKMLAVDAEAARVTMLVRLAPGADYPAHRHAGVEELHLLDGELMIDDKKLLAGDFIRAEAGTVDHRVWSETGCTCFLVTSANDAIL